MRFVKSVLFILIAALLLAGCNMYKNIPYFKDVPDTLKTAQIVNMANVKTPVIRPDDILSILIQSVDPSVTSIYNRDTKSTAAITSAMPSAFQPNGIGQQAPSLASAQLNAVSGYLVDKNGNIELPLIGKTKISGLTTREAADSIKNLLSLYYKDLTVDVRYSNFQVTVLGEVLRPATYTLPNERITVLDALGLAGDLTIYGKRENVLLIRDSTADQKQLIRLNLTSKDIMMSPYFFLKQNDVIYVEPNKQKLASLDAARTRNIVIGSSIVTLLIAFFTYTKK